MQIEPKKTAELKPHPKNPKNHTKEQITHIANSICQFGWTQPLVVDELGTILVGHGRWQAAQELKYAEVPTVQVKNLSDVEKLALLTFDNSSNLETGFDPRAMEHVYAELARVGYDMNGLGLYPEVIGDEVERGQDKNTLSESYKRYEEGETKRIVLYFTPSEYDEINQRINKIMREEEIPAKGDLLSAMLLEYERNYGLL